MSISYGRKWWESTSLLEQFKIEAYHDIRSICVNFRKSFAFEGDKMLRYAQIQIDVHQLEFGRMTIEDVDRELSRIMRQDEDYTHRGVTNRELRDPRIREAWEALQILRRLIGSDRG